ncbi:MAG: hypothetical protein JST93_00435 [Acidobacteria bacterium]|nr:hypothetical protein [Acidobacteriota bacterium]
MRNLILLMAFSAALGVAAWSLASATGRVDADERVSAMLPPPSRPALWDPSEHLQALSFGGQAAIGVALLAFAWKGLRRRAS